MNDMPLLVDRDALGKRRARVKDDALFLHRAAIEDVQDRLSLVNKSFTAPAIVTPFAGLWQGVLPDARIVPDDEVLPLEAGAHDLAIHAMALHWANDPVGQLIQCRRALRPDGLMIACLFAGQTLNELRTVLAQAESDLTGGLSPRVAPMPEIRDLGGLLQRAGLALPVADSFALKVQYRSLRHLCQELRDMGETNALSGRLRHPSRRAIFDHASALYEQQFPAPGGDITATFEIVTLTGWAPDPSQQQPLRPGSAQARLADALNSSETKLSD